jgi:hypothetical protein
MRGPTLMVEAGPVITRVLLVVDGTERLRATFPWNDLPSLAEMVDALAAMLNDHLSVVLYAARWGSSSAAHWSESCDEGNGCNAGHLDCPWALREFERMRERLRAMGDL